MYDGAICWVVCGWLLWLRIGWDSGYGGRRLLGRCGCWVGAVGTGPVWEAVISAYLVASSVNPATAGVTLKKSVIASNDSCANRAFSPFR